MEHKMFVVKFLRPFLKVLDERIVDVFYHDTKLNGEFVYIFIKGGECIHLCITGDGTLEIAEKAIKELSAVWQQAN